MQKPEFSKRKVLIVEDHQLFREGLAQLINREPDLTVCGEAEDIQNASKMLKKCKPDLLIVDISLADGSGINLIKAVRAKDTKLGILVLSMHDESLYAERALRAGANGYIMKQEANKKVKEALRCVLKGEVFLSEKMSGKMMSKLVGSRPEPEPSPMETLSQRELEVFQMIGQGSSTRHIAQTLKLSVPTINSFRARIKEKLSLANGHELTLQALQWVQNKRNA